MYTFNGRKTLKTIYNLVNESFAGFREQQQQLLIDKKIVSATCWAGT
jgi:hypothetical protein